MVLLFGQTDDAAYLDAAQRAARFLCEHAWDEPLQTFPFEHPSPSDESEHRAYFFDCGIIIRGLLAVWRVTREPRLLEVAVAASRGMIADFHSGDDYHPILELPEKQSLERKDHWSRSPGCYQLKSAMAWWEVSEITRDASLRTAYFEMLDACMASYREFLPGITKRTGIMDRLHAYCYFLEGLTPVLDRPECREALDYGIGEAGRYLREIAPEFARSDVYAQVMRAKVCAGAVLQNEAEALAGFQARSDDPRVDGAFLFGRRDGELVPHANPVLTAFAVQALELASPCQPI